MKELRILMINDIASRIINDFEDRIWNGEYIEEWNEYYKEDNDNRDIYDNYSLKDIYESNWYNEKDKNFFISYLNNINDFEGNEYFEVFSDSYEEEYLNEGYELEDIYNTLNEEWSVEDTTLLNDLLHDRFNWYC